MADNPKGELQDALSAFLNQSTAERPARPVAPLPANPGAPSSPAPSTPTVTTAGDKRELLAAFDRLVEHEANRPTGPVLPMESRVRKYLVPAVGAMAAVATLYLWIARPAWLYPRLDQVPMATTSWQAQQMLIAASALVNQYQQQTGRYPVDLKEVGLNLPSLSIGPDEGGFRIVGGTQASPMYLRSQPGRPLQIEVFPR